MKKNSVKDLIIRYFILVLVAVPNLYLFYLIFTPLTLYPLYFILKLFFDVTLQNGIIYFGGYTIELIDACIAGSAYYLLLMLNLATPNINIKRRLLIIATTFISFLIVNILRIFLLSLLLFSGSNLFDITHKVFWYSVSTIFVVLIWFINVKLFKIKEIPFYSDVHKLISLSFGSVRKSAKKQKNFLNIKYLFKKTR
ncbi:MAG: pacearchaeosortase [archaeon]|nr:pacearchaeosortase [archaeon]